MKDITLEQDYPINMSKAKSIYLEIVQTERGYRGCPNGGTSDIYVRRKDYITEEPLVLAMFIKDWLQAEILHESSSEIENGIGGYDFDQVEASAKPYCEIEFITITYSGKLFKLTSKVKAKKPKKDKDKKLDMKALMAANNMIIPYGKKVKG